MVVALLKAQNVRGHSSARKIFNALDLHWHDLRHESASRLAELGLPITKIQYLLGHASIVTTELYIHHTLAGLAKAAAVLEDGGGFDPNMKPTVGKRRPPSSHPRQTTKPDVH